IDQGHNTQIDYLLVRKGDLKACRDCRAFPGETCSSRHRLVIVDILFEKRRHRREATGRLRILWKNLKGEAVETFRANVSEKLSALEDVMPGHNADQMWKTFADVIRDVAKDSLEDIDLAKERYKAAKREAKIDVAQAKDEAYEDLCHTSGRGMDGIHVAAVMVAAGGEWRGSGVGDGDVAATWIG
nr:hypothetical protein [Tanacetum cinerariifolium]